MDELLAPSTAAHPDSWRNPHTLWFSYFFLASLREMISMCRQAKKYPPTTVRTSQGYNCKYPQNLSELTCQLCLIVPKTWSFSGLPLSGPVQYLVYSVLPLPFSDSKLWHCQDLVPWFRHQFSTDLEPPLQPDTGHLRTPSPQCSNSETSSCPPGCRGFSQHCTSSGACLCCNARLSCVVSTEVVGKRGEFKPRFGEEFLTKN